MEVDKAPAAPQQENAAAAPVAAAAPAAAAALDQNNDSLNGSTRGDKGASVASQNPVNAKDQLLRILSTVVGVDQQREARILFKLGLLCKEHLKDNAEAITYFNRCIELSLKLGHQTQEGSCHMHLGTIYLSQQDSKNSVVHYEAALSIAKTIGNLSGQAQVGLELARAYSELKDYKNALSRCQDALESCRSLNNKKLEGVALFNNSVFYGHTGQLAKAIECCEQSVDIAKELELTDTVQSRNRHLDNLKRKLALEQEAARRAQWPFGSEAEHFSQAMNYFRRHESGGNTKTFKPTEAQKLKLGALMRQACFGNNPGPKPFFFSSELPAWEAWSEVGGLHNETAKKQFVELLTSVNARWVDEQAKYLKENPNAKMEELKRPEPGVFSCCSVRSKAN